METFNWEENELVMGVSCVVCVVHCLGLVFSVVLARDQGMQ